MATMLRPGRTDAVLRDGSTVSIRSLSPGDESALLAFLRGLSSESRAFRYFAGTGDSILADTARTEAHADPSRRLNVIATTGDPERIVGHAVCVRVDSDRAEVAFAVADEYQGRGLGTILLGYLAEVTGRVGVSAFVAYVLPANHAMLDVFRNSGFPLDVVAGPGELVVTFPTKITPDALDRFADRERIATTNALRAFFAPRAVAVIGASRQRGTIGGEIFHNLLADGFAGPVYPVNPAAGVVQSVLAYPSIEAVPGRVDLAVIAVPAEHVVDVARDCARVGVRALVVISAGFAETDDAGRGRQDELLRVCRASGMRLIGPNCMGIINTDPAVRLNATFASASPPVGRVGFFSQSGALGIAILDYASAVGVGVSSFVSIGNKADISGNDLLEYWEADPRTDVILLYLESFGNPRKFSRIARRVGRTKPIIAVKSGRSPAGVRATQSHTGSLLAASDITVDALFRQAGVIRTDTLGELFDVAVLLSTQPPPAGPRVGIVTNAGGPGILCADACQAEGLDVPPLADATTAALREFLPPQASVGNPVDMLASAPAAHYLQAIRAVGADPNIDAVIAIFIPPLVTEPEHAAEAIVRAARDLAGTKPVLTVFMSSRGVPPALRGAVEVPSYAFPEDAAIALARVVRYGQWRARPPVEVPPLDGIGRDRAASVVATALGRGGSRVWLSPDEVAALLTSYGLPVAAQQVVTTPLQAGAAAEALGGNVALKAFGPGLLHKSDAGAIRLNLSGGGAVRAAAEEMSTRLEGAGQPVDGFLVQAMAPPGVEMLVGVVSDPQFGPTVAVGAGGVLVELLKDVTVRLTPIGPEDAREMVRELKSYPLLAGYRGRPAADAAALEDIIVRIGAMAEDLPQITELDCNPIIVSDQGAAIVDARVRVAPEALRPQVVTR
ncbi:MAG TPA: GNAT family N-acetyltransferase [bacterium]|nr:GNAT family N-acetyltransferase [bacterium]